MKGFTMYDFFSLIWWRIVLERAWEKKSVNVLMICWTEFYWSENGMDQQRRIVI